MTDNKEKVLDQDKELNLEKDGDKIVGGALFLKPTQYFRDIYKSDTKYAYDAKMEGKP